MAIMIYGSHYTVSATITNPGAVANLGVQSAATRWIALVYASIEPAQAALVTDAGAVLQIGRKSTAPTGTAIAANTFLNHDAGGSDATSTAYHTATTQGTTSRSIAYGWNSRVGFEWRPSPEEYITAAAGVANGLALISTTAPPAGVYIFKMTFVEMG